MKRTQAAQLAIQNAAIAEAGYYTNPDLVTREIRHALAQAIEHTVEYREGKSPALKRALHVVHDTALRVENTTTFAAAKALADRGLRVAALNFASAKNPGGGYLNGSSAQEEYLCRSALLYDCLVGREMYRYHRAQSDCLYSDWVIYSPAVPVIRDDEGALLEEPWLCGVLTSPAPNAGVVLRGAGRRRGEVTKALRARMGKVLEVAAAHGHDGLVLGAWGCGVFQNDPVEVAMLWEEALLADFRGVFKEVAFAVLDTSAQGRCIAPFEARFG
jgi:uncharacterized protein (TIGR02452 family)